MITYKILSAIILTMSRKEGGDATNIHRLIETAHISTPPSLKSIARDRYILAISEALELYGQAQKGLKGIDRTLNWGSDDDRPLLTVFSPVKNAISSGIYDLRQALEALGEEELLDRIDESVKTGHPPYRFRSVK